MPNKLFAFIQKPFGQALLFFLAICAVIGILHLATSQLPNNTSNNINLYQEVKKQLPAGWQPVDNVANTELKLTKTTTDSFQPNVAVIKILAVVQDPDSYTLTLIKGARSAIPTLVFTTNTVSHKNGYFVRNLEGTYVNGKKSIAVKQELLIKNGVVYNLTASYDPIDKAIKTDISTIFEVLSQHLTQS